MKCSICNKECKNLNALSSHITKSHKDISHKYYYDTYMSLSKTNNICQTCGKETPFINLAVGYKKHCNRVCSNKDQTIINIRHETLSNTFGHPFSRPEILEKCKMTCIEKYGVNNPYQIEYIKAKSHNKEALEKHYQTLKRNNTFKTSKQEDDCYNILCKHFNTVLRNHKTDKYPYKCDFYIEDIDAYVECNFHWTHNNHWFNETDSNDIDISNSWMNRSKYFDNAIHVWTIRDVAKRKCAKDNRLNYIVLWNYTDFQDWLDTNFEIRHDY